VKSLEAEGSTQQRIGAVSFITAQPQATTYRALSEAPEGSLVGLYEDQ